MKCSFVSVLGYFHFNAKRFSLICCYVKSVINQHSQLINVRKHPELLRGKALQELPVLNNAWLQIIDGRIADYGTMDICPDVPESINLNGACVLPCWCDSHTHVVFATSREDEFVDKLKGLSYAE